VSGFLNSNHFWHKKTFPFFDSGKVLGAGGWLSRIMVIPEILKALIDKAWSG
jgi:hypothetical protein